jgi:hypothetical protein
MEQSGCAFRPVENNINIKKKAENRSLAGVVVVLNIGFLLI